LTSLPGKRTLIPHNFHEGNPSMSKALFTLAVLSSAFSLPLTAHADTIDDFVLTGNGEIITFSLPASPPGNLSTCPTGIVTSCLPGSQTDFSAFTVVTINGVSALEGIDFPTGHFLGGLSLGLDPGRLLGNQLFTPDAANPTFLIGTFDLSKINPSGDPPFFDYTLSITPEASTASTPEPSTFALLGTGLIGAIAAVGRRPAAQPQQ
jgi:hypothetical protein